MFYHILNPSDLDSIEPLWENPYRRLWQYKGDSKGILELWERMENE
jgi:hypothetical protein